MDSGKRKGKHGTFKKQKFVSFKTGFDIKKKIVLKNIAAIKRPH